MLLETIVGRCCGMGKMVKKITRYKLLFIKYIRHGDDIYSIEIKCAYGTNRTLYVTYTSNK